MEGAGGGGMGEMPGTSSNLLDAGAQEFYPSMAAASYSFPPVAQQVYCPPPYAAPMAFPMAVPPPAPQAEYVRPATAAGDAAPARAVVLSMVPRHAPEAEVAVAMAAFGAVRAVDASALAAEGVATVHFFDLRAAEAAVAGVREQHVRQQSRLGQLYAAASGSWAPAAAAAAPWDWPLEGASRGLVMGQAVWAHFAAAGAGVDDGANRGCLVVLNSLPGVSLRDLREAFERFGEVKEVREAAQRPHHKFVEFFDTREAARALAKLNGTECFGRRLIVKFTHSGGAAAAAGARRRSPWNPYHPSFPTPPRLLRGPAAAPPPPASLSPPLVSPRGKQPQQQREGAVVLLRRSSNAKAETSNDAGGSGGGGGGNERRSKGGGAANSCALASAAASASGKQVRKGSGGGNWRAQKSGWEARFLFKEGEGSAAAGEEPAAASGSSCKDSRTTVMIRNIPNKYSQKLLLNMLDNHCIHCNERILAAASDQPLSAYDFIYLPIDFNNKCNVGYGFVNLTSPEAAVRLYRAFHKQPWEVFNSRKICQVTYARLQGLEALKEHFKNSKFACDCDEYLPVVFAPPRDGKNLTEPVPICGRSASSKRAAAPAPASGVDPLAEALAAPPSSGDGASSSTASTHADDCDREPSAGGEESDDERLARELRGLGYGD